MALAHRASTEAGTGSAATSLAINVPAGVQDGDHLVLFGVTADGDDGGFDALSGWTEVVDAATHNTGGSAPSPPGMSVWTRIASSEPASYTITPSFGSTGIAAKMIAFSGGDQTTQLDVTSTLATGDGTNANPASINSGSGADGFAVIVAAFWDSTTTVWSAAPTNYTDAGGLGSVTGDGGGNGCTMAIAYKTTNVDPAAAEDPGTFTSSAEQWGTVTVALRPAPVGISDVVPDEFDMDNADIDIESSSDVFDASGNDVYLSDVDTLAGGPNEVDISSAINTEAVGLINLDLTQLSAGELSSLHTLGPSATRYIIVDASGGEYSWPVTLHRPQAFEFVAGLATPGTTTDRLTGSTGTFGGGRIEEAAAQNPSTTLTNVADDGNREDVACIQAKDLARETTYRFKLVWPGPTDSDTVTNITKITIAAGAEAALTTVAGTSAVGSVGNSVAVALTGVAGTSAVGSVAPSSNLDVTGVEATGAVGSVGFTESGSSSLSGIEATGEVGTVSQSRTVALTGVSATSAAGSISPGIAPAAGITGVEATGEVGTVTENHSGSAPLSGVEGTGAVGSVGFTESGAVGLTGVEAAGQVGSVTPSSAGSAQLTGVEGTGEIGSVGNSVEVALTGVAAVGAVGSLGVDRDVPLTGEEATGAVGSVTASSQGSAAITGIEGTGLVGSIGFTKSGTLALTGVESTGDVGDLANSTSIALLGAPASTGVGSVGAEVSGGNLSALMRTVGRGVFQRIFGRVN